MAGIPTCWAHDTRARYLGHTTIATHIGTSRARAILGSLRHTLSAARNPQRIGAKPPSQARPNGLPSTNRTFAAFSASLSPAPFFSPKRVALPYALRARVIHLVSHSRRRLRYSLRALGFPRQKPSYSLPTRIPGILVSAGTLARRASPT